MNCKEVVCDGFLFRFTDAIHVFKFDETDRNKPEFHGAPMKAVDLVAELETAYLFVEIKDYADQDQDLYDFRAMGSGEQDGERKKAIKWLKNYLKYKFRDSFLYRHAEGKVDKPIHYICLLTFDNPMNNYFAKMLRPELPTGKASRRWSNHLAQSCHVLNVERWNANYPKWPVSKIEVA